MFLGIFHSEFGMPPIGRNVFPKILDNFYIGIISSYYMNFETKAMPMFELLWSKGLHLGLALF